MIANSKGQNLIDHSKAVAAVAREIAQLCGYDERLQKIAYWAGLLHDIGKATKSFQDYLSSGQSAEEAISPMHHEISWAYLVNNYGIASNDNRLMFNAIYWHHARPLNDKYEYLKSRDEIVDKIKDSDVKRISKLIESVELPEHGAVLDTGEDVPPLFYPDTRHENINAELLAVRMCLISADRLVSQMSAEEVAATACGTVSPGVCLPKNGRPHVETIPCPAPYKPERFQIQLSCAQEVRKHRTTVVKAPAGFGKTMIGVLYTLLQGKQSYWVCPAQCCCGSCL